MNNVIDRGEERVDRFPASQYQSVRDPDIIVVYGARNAQKNTSDPYRKSGIHIMDKKISGPLRAYPHLE
jgi:hypothetical protein